MGSAITVLSIVTPILGMGLLIAAIFKHRERLAHLKRAEVLEGLVSDLEEDEEDDTKWPYFTVVLPDGTTERFKGTVASDPPIFSIGERVKIYFSANANPRFIAGDKLEIWFVVGILYLSGLSGLLAPLVLILLKSFLPH